MTAVDVARALPGIEVLRARCRALAVLEAIVSPEWESRYYSYAAGWAPGQELASMSNGSGDHWNIVFQESGAIVLGFAHESVMSPAGNDEELWPGLVDDVPAVFTAQLAEPAFFFENTLDATVCLWRETGDDRWHLGNVEFPAGRPDPDGADELFDVLVSGAYAEFAADYYEVALDEAAVAEIFALRPLTAELVRRLNSETSLDELADDLAGIGYPVR